MGKYIDADKLLQKISDEIDISAGARGCFSDYEAGLDDAYAIIKQQPAADVQEVTRCKNCVFVTYIHNNKTDDVRIFRCELHSIPLKDEDSYCSWGKRCAQPINECGAMMDEEAE